MIKQINFPELLRRFRKDKMLTQRQAADLCGVSRPTWGAMEEHRCEPRIIVLITIANIWNRSIDDILNDKKSNPNQKVLKEKLFQQYNKLSGDRKKIVDFILNLK